MKDQDKAKEQPMKEMEPSLQDSEREKKANVMDPLEENLRRVIESAPDGVYINDIKGTFLYGNTKAEKITGYTRKELIGKSFLKLDLLPKSHLVKAGKLLALNVLGKSTGPDEFELKRKDGSYIWTEITTTPIKEQNRVVVIGFVRDITERKQVEEKLKSERDKLQAVMSGLARSGIGIDIVGVDYIVRFQNDFLQEGFGDIVGKLCYENYMALKEPCDFCPMEKAIRSKKLESVELTAADGRDYELLSAPLPNPDGTIDQVIEIVRDITERKKTQEALKESEIRFRSAFDQAYQLSGIVGTDGTLLEINNLVSEIQGRSRSENAIGKPFWESDFWADDEARKGAKLGIESALGGKIFQDECNYLSANDNIRIASRTFAPIKDKNDEIVFINVQGLDITERKQAEEEIAKFKTIADNATYGVTITDIDGHMLYLNKAHAEMHGYTIDELIGKHYSILYTEDQAKKVMAARKKLFAEGSHSGESWRKRKDGTTFSTLATRILIRDDIGQPQYIATTHFDLTDRKKMEEQLIVTDRLASIGELASGIAHELNNPLTGVIGFADLLLEKEGNNQMQIKPSISHFDLFVHSLNKCLICFIWDKSSFFI